MKTKFKLLMATPFFFGANLLALDVDQLQFFGYGNINYEKYDYYENKQTITPEKRTKVDLETFVFVTRYLLDDSTTIISEIEYEHGGTGSTIEYDGGDEAGEFETEIEKGGEIVVEELNVIFTANPKLSFRVGHFPVAVGMLTSRHLPSLYHSATRNISESRVIPSTWHETGVEVYGSVLDNKLHYQAQLVNGLNSENFNSDNWIKNGMQTQLEHVNADALAFVTRVSYGDLVGNQVGFSFYRGDTNKNREKTRLKSKGTVQIISLHGIYSYGNTDIKAMYLFGTLDDTREIKQANYNMFIPSYVKGYKPKHTDLGKEAIAYFVEVGHNIAPLTGLPKKTTLWGRYDFSDTMYAVDTGNSKNKKFEETTYSFGLNYHYSSNLIFKSEFTKTSYGAVLDDSNTMKLSMAFQF